MSIRFKFAAHKALEAIQLMLANEHQLDLHAALKACYFADKSHLNEQGRPIFGATYRAMKFGPVPLEVYEMLKGEPIWLAELGLDRFPWVLDGHRLISKENAEPQPIHLSETDEEHLLEGLRNSLSMTFTERTAATHGPDWQAAELGLMRYEDMIDERPDKAMLLAYLEENGRFMHL